MAFAEDIGEETTHVKQYPRACDGAIETVNQEEGILAGVEIGKMVLHRFDPDLQVEVAIEDGTPVKPGDVALPCGAVRSMLQTERLVLNIMQRMSGIATITRGVRGAAAGTNTKVLDTGRPRRECGYWKSKP